jgi:hypothetical protein
MGLPDRLRGRQEQELRVVVLPGGSSVEVRGEASYQDALARICGGKCKEGHNHPVTAVLWPEPTNQYDGNAGRVRVDGLLVGYLAREEAARYSAVLQRMQNKIGATGACKASIVGGWDRGGGDSGHFGIWLDIASPQALGKL